MLVGRLDSGVGSESESAPGVDRKAEIVARFSLFADLFSEDRAGEADTRVTVGDDADAVGTATSFTTQLLMLYNFVGAFSSPKVVSIEKAA